MGQAPVNKETIMGDNTGNSVVTIETSAGTLIELSSCLAR